MPQLLQSKKALRKSLKRAARNKAARTVVSNLVKKTKKAIEAKEAKAEELIRATIKKIDQAAQKGLLKKNTAARKKSRLMKMLNKSKQ